jgi:Zn ribbon nucleic-acid-binding protein
MKKAFSIILILLVLTVFTVSYARAQSTDELKLGLSRDFGYGGFGNDIQGLFSMKISNPPDTVIRVVFLIDVTSIGEDTQPPFALQFNTDSYALGLHTLSATGYTSDGKELHSNEIQANFVPASAGMQSVIKIVVPVFGLIFIMIIVMVAVPLISSRGKNLTLPLGEPRKYGIGGGAVCPKCNRPFPLRLWWINVGFSKIDRCPYCGKWSLVRPRSLADLRAAEAAELAQAQSGTSIVGESEADKLKKELDDSRFQNM